MQNVEECAAASDVRAPARLLVQGLARLRILLMEIEQGIVLVISDVGIFGPAPESACVETVLLEDGPLAGITARAVVVLDENDKVVYRQLVPEIGQEPDYDKALAAARP